MKKLICFLFLGFALISANAQDDQLKEYIGVYKFPDGSPITSVEVKLENGVLVGYSTMGSSALERMGKDTFSIVAYNGVAYFSRTENTITGVRMEVQDLILEGKKQMNDLVILNRKHFANRNQVIKVKQVK